MTGETDGEKDAVIKFDGDIVYVYQVHGGSVDEGYYTQEGSKYYYYAVYEDGKCIRQEIDEIQIMDILLIPTLLDSVLSPTFNEFTYDAQTGLYKAETISTNPNASNYEIEFENGKVISISTRVGESDQTMTFNYDEVTLTLPEVTA